MKINSGTITTIALVGGVGYLVLQARKEARKSEPIVGPWGIRFPRF